ncbi:selenium-binding protein SBP56-related protein [Micromonospora sp. NPDC049282]|uniref:selenium-binding protein SBP56-related protein n=1 Tax=Micromonospora sp. NPDC049282 TaxID=3364269 RepID=UPI00371FB182
MTRWTPDPSFYPSPALAAAAPAEKLAYVAAFDRAGQRPDAIAVLDTDPDSDTYGRVVRVGSVRLGGIVDRTPHPAFPDEPLAGGPQMVEISRDGRRVYVSNSLYGAWDDQFYPDGVGAWVAKLDVDPEHGGLVPDPRFFPRGDEFRGRRVHQTRLQGGDASSDSYCFP